jgi:hypothetical protein
MKKKYHDMKLLGKVLILSLVIIFCSCSQNQNTKNQSEQNIFNGFVNPPSESRPFVRWWWNGNHISAGEIKRELDILHSAGIGGIEINPIAMPEDAPNINTEPIKWLSREWNELFALAATEAKKRDMIADVIVGSGWPFGGEFLNEEETIQRVITNKISCSGGDNISLSENDLINKALQTLNTRSRSEGSQSNEILFIQLVPKDINSLEEISDLTDQFKENSILNFVVPQGEYNLAYGIRQRGHRQVMHGALGAAGPVMDHYKQDVTLSYLNRLIKISEDTGIPLKELIRALFCDSIELAGANWTDGFKDIFFDEYNYEINPYLSFIFYEPHEGYDLLNYDAAFSDKILRARYDFNNLLVKVFLENFTETFQQFCTDNGLLCRYQAYGTPFLMGMMEGNMIPDIPESNNWIYSSDMNADQWEWNQQHGYMIWNLYAASGGHLTGRDIISCEAMTNTRGVFKTSLEEIKQHDDMNFISGINHSVLHGFNYSPPGAGFPGWVRYGAYFSEQNTWWPYFSEWADYNARLSYIFQQSQPVKNIAILPPTDDIWAKIGLSRGPFHMKPWYCFRLWESLSQAGSSCDYISGKIIREGTVEEGLLKYGPMSYQAVILISNSSMDPLTALALEKYVETGGRIVMIDSIPNRSLSMEDAVSGDKTVQDVFSKLTKNFSEQLFFIKSPSNETELLSWTKQLLKKINIEKDVNIVNPDKNIFQIRKKAGEKDIYFFTNSNRSRTISLNATFPVKNKTPWRWNPENGTRNVYRYAKKGNELKIELAPLESLLLIFDGRLKGKPAGINNPPHTVHKIVEGPWQGTFKHVDGSEFNHTFEELTEFGTSGDPKFGTFAGTVSYVTKFESDGHGNRLELGQTNKGVTEVFINDKPAGLNWYGKPIFQINNLLKEGENLLEIKYTTVLSNYVRSLNENPTAKKWASGYEQIACGLEGDVKIYK